MPKWNLIEKKLSLILNINLNKILKMILYERKKKWKKKIKRLRPT